MWNPFACRCSAKRLHVKKRETIEYGDFRTESYGTERSIYVTYHLYCLWCRKTHDVKYVRFEEKQQGEPQ